MSDQVLHLVVPGLLGPMPHLADVAAGQRFPLIERWLARADRSTVPGDAERLLFELVGVESSPTEDLPTAAVCYLADTGRPPASVVYHATPVHLLPDQDRLLLFDAPAADLTMAEAAAFVTAFNAHFATDGWRLEAPTAARWYLHLAMQPELRTRPLGDVVGRNLDRFLPQGRDAADWRRCLNEVQMLFHTLAVNAAREARGRPAVNGLWLHGGGRLPHRPRLRPVVQGLSTPLLDGLRMLAGEAGGEIRLQWLDRVQRTVWDADPQAWLDAVRQVEEGLSGQSGEAVLYPGDGHGYRLAGRQRWRLWRRPRPLTESLLPESLD